MKPQLIYIALLTLILESCASVQATGSQYQTGSFPELNAPVTVNVGEVMVSEYDYLSQNRAILREAIRGSLWTGRNSLIAGASLVEAVSEGVTVYCQPPGGVGNPCLRDSDGDGYFDRASVMNLYGMLVSPSNIDPVGYRVSNPTIEDGFKYELLYQGVDGNVARIAYREYTDNLARPAFSQDLSYTLSDGTTSISFREVSITIQDANNNDITYTVESGF